MATASLTLQFLLELVALAGLGYWGFATGGGSFAKVALAVGPPLLAAIARSGCPGVSVAMRYVAIPYFPAGCLRRFADVTAAGRWHHRRVGRSKPN